jgi:hypothetical protein
VHAEEVWLTFSKLVCLMRFMNDRVFLLQYSTGLPDGLFSNQL